MKPSPKSPLLALMLVAACMGGPAPGTPGDPRTLESQSPFIEGLDVTVAAATLTRILGRPVTTDAVLRMGDAEAYRIIHEWGLENDLRRLAGLSGDAAEQLQQAIEVKRRAIATLTTVAIQDSLARTMPTDFEPGDGACSETPELLNIETTHTIERSTQGSIIRIHSSSSQTTNRDMKRSAENSMSVRNASTGERVHGSDRSRSRPSCNSSAMAVHQSVSLNALGAGVAEWCVETSGKHQAWNDAGDAVEAETQNPAGCERLSGR